MSEKNQKRLLWGGAIIAGLIILWLLFRASPQMMGGSGQLGPMSGPGSVNVGGLQIPGLPGMTIPAPWMPPIKDCRCGCDNSSGGSPFALMGYPTNILHAQAGVF